MELIPEQVFVGALTIWATVPVGVRGDLKRQDVAEGMESLGKLKEMKKASLSPSRKVLEICLVSPQCRDSILQTGLPLKGKNVTLQFNMAKQSTIDVSVMDAPLEFDNAKIKDKVSEYGELEEWYEHEWTYKTHHILSGIRVFRFNRLFRAIPQTLLFGGRQCRILYTGDGKHRWDERKKEQADRQEAAREEQERKRAEQEELERREREKEDQKTKDHQDRLERKRQKKKAEEERIAEKKRQEEEQRKKDEETKRAEMKQERAKQKAADLDALKDQLAKIPQSCAPPVEKLMNAFTATTEYDAEREDAAMDWDEESRKRSRDRTDSDDVGGAKRDREDSVSSLEPDASVVAPVMGDADGDVLADLFGDVASQETEEVEPEEADELVTEEHDGDRVHKDTPNQAAVFLDKIVVPYIRKRGMNITWNWVSALLFELPNPSEGRRLLLLDCLTEWPRSKIVPFLAMHFEEVHGTLTEHPSPHVPDLSPDVSNVWFAWQMHGAMVEEEKPLFLRRVKYIIDKRLDVTKLC